MIRPTPILTLALGLALVHPGRDAAAQGPTAPAGPARPDRAELIPPSELPAAASRPRRSLEADARRAGFRNPGGVGRRAQYYPAGDRFQNEGRGAIPVPTFGGFPSYAGRAMQLRAQRVGIERAAATRRHIDAYGQPLRFLWFWPVFGDGPGSGLWP